MHQRGIEHEPPRPPITTSNSYVTNKVICPSQPDTTATAEVGEIARCTTVSTTKYHRVPPKTTNNHQQFVILPTGLVVCGAAAAGEDIKCHVPPERRIITCSSLSLSTFSCGGIIHI